MDGTTVNRFPPPEGSREAVGPSGHPVSETARPSLRTSSTPSRRLAGTVAASPSSRLDPFVSVSLRRACEELRRYIPGLDSPPDPEAARFLARAAYAAMEDNDAREALARALRGLSFSPHHRACSSSPPRRASSSARWRMRSGFCVTLWIHPATAAARRTWKR